MCVCVCVCVCVCACVCRHGVVLDLIYWRDAKKTGVVFGSTLVLLLSLALFSVLSVLAYLSLVTLTITISYRVYRSILASLQKTGEGHPFQSVLCCCSLPALVTPLQFYLGLGVERGDEYYDYHVCGSVYIPAYLINLLSKLQQISVRVIHNRGSILFCWQCNMLYTAFSVSTLLVGRQERHPACKN